MPNEAVAAEVEATGEEVDANDIAADVFPMHFDKAEAPPVAAKAKAAPVAKEKSTEETEATDGNAESETDGESASEGDAAKEALAKVDNDELFSDAALNTPAGIKSAREAVTEARKAARAEKVATHRVFLRTQRREEVARQNHAEANRVGNVNRALHQRLVSDLDVLRNGTAEQVIETIGRLTGRSGAEAYEQITSAMIANGQRKPAQRDPELVALLRQQQEQIAALGRTNAQQAEARAREGWRSEMTRAVQSDGFPALNEAFKEHGRELIDRLDEIKASYWRDHGEVLADATLLAHFEKKLGGYKARASTPPAAAPVAPAAAARRRNLPGKSISTTRSSTDGGTRELSDDERFAELVAEPGILQRLGL